LAERKIKMLKCDNAFFKYNKDDIIRCKVDGKPCGYACYCPITGKFKLKAEAKKCKSFKGEN